MSLFKAKRFTKTYIHKWVASPPEVFPLLCPVREYEWIDGWRCEMIYSECGVAEEGCIFKTFPGEEDETIWVMTKQDSKNYIAQFVRVTPGSMVVVMDICLDNSSGGNTDARVTYTCTALNGKGNAFIDSRAADYFQDAAVRLEKSMNHFLKTGHKLKI